MPGDDLSYGQELLGRLFVLAGRMQRGELRVTSEDDSGSAVDVTHECGTDLFNIAMDLVDILPGGENEPIGSASGRPSA